MRKSLQTRTITALVLLAVFVLLLFTLSPRLWEITTLAIVAIAAWEWAKLAGVRAKIIYALVTAAAGLGLSLFEERSGVIANEYLPATVFWVVLVPLWLASGWQTKSVALLAATGWIVLLPAWLAVVDLRALDPALLLWMMSVIWLADTAAYFAGKAFGKRKLAPIISPNKTWEGVAGAFSAVALYAILGTVFGLDGY
ncbi:MAG: phosphatidate cytidylyltransferase, partial [Burkholderiales bacterium]